MKRERIPKPHVPSSTLGRATTQRTGSGDSAQEKPLSRQRKWQLKQVAKGNCEKCGQPAVIGSVSCPKHLRKKRKYNRKLRGSIPYAICGRGKPALPLKTREVSQ